MQKTVRQMVVIALSVFWGLPAHAKLSSVSNIDSKATGSQLELGVGGDSLWGSTTLDVRFKGAGKNWGAEAHAEAILADPALTRGAPNELFFRAWDVLTIGQKRVDWNTADQVWGLGVWEPRNRADLLYPERLGNFGLSVAGQAGPFHATVMGMPILVPDLGPAFVNKNGEFVKTSPWFPPPSRIAEVMGYQKTMRHFIQMPSAGNLLLHPGFAASVGYDGPVYARASYARKPNPSPLFKYDGYYNIPTDTVDADVRVRVSGHQVIGVDAGLSDGPVRPWISAFREIPDPESSDGIWTIQTLSPATIASAGIALRFSESVRADLSHLRVFGGEVRDYGPDNQTGASVFEPRFWLTSATRASVQMDGLLFGRRLTTKLSGTQDWASNGAVFGTEFSLVPADRWSIFLGADVLVLWNRDAGVDPNQFVNFFRANDRFRLGVTHVF